MTTRRSWTPNLQRAAYAAAQGTVHRSDALCRRIRGSDHPPRIFTAGYHRRLSAVAAYAALNRQLAFQLKVYIVTSELIQSGTRVPIWFGILEFADGLMVRHCLQGVELALRGLLFPS